MTKEIYGWAIVHAPTGMNYAFCTRVVGNKTLTEEDVLADCDRPEDFILIPLVRADSIN